MSVAFRRESDDEHKEPKFDIPIPPGPNLVTERGLKLIEDKVAELERLDSPDEEQQRELRYWRQRLATAQIGPQPGGDEVGFGSRIAFTLNKTKREIRIVGEDEADPAHGTIAHVSPLARALTGKQVGDVVPAGDDEAEILAIA